MKNTSAKITLLLTLLTSLLLSTGLALDSIGTPQMATRDQISEEIERIEQAEGLDSTVPYLPLIEFHVELMPLRSGETLTDTFSAVPVMRFIRDNFDQSHIDEVLLFAAAQENLMIRRRAICLSEHMAKEGITTILEDEQYTSELDQVQIETLSSAFPDGNFGEQHGLMPIRHLSDFLPTVLDNLQLPVQDTEDEIE